MTCIREEEDWYCIQADVDVYWCTLGDCHHQSGMFCHLSCQRSHLTPWARLIQTWLRCFINHYVAAMRFEALGLHNHSVSQRFTASDVTTYGGIEICLLFVFFWPTLLLLILLSASLYVSKRGAYWDRLCHDVVGRWLSRACTVAKRCILGL